MFQGFDYVANWCWSKQQSIQMIPLCYTGLHSSWKAIIVDGDYTRGYDHYQLFKEVCFSRLVSEIKCKRQDVLWNADVQSTTYYIIMETPSTSRTGFALRWLTYPREICSSIPQSFTFFQNKNLILMVGSFLEGIFQLPDRWTSLSFFRCCCKLF